MKKIILCAFLIGVCGVYPAIAASTLPDSDLDGGFTGGDSDLEAEITPNPGAGIVGSCTAYPTGQSCTLTNCDTCINYQYTTPAGFHNNFLSCAKCVSGYTMDSYSVDNACLNLKSNRCTKDQLAACINCSCMDQTHTVANGYLKTVKQYCDPNNDCKCATSSTTYSCESDYYQNQSGSSVSCTYKQSGSYQCSGCTACPSNATCNGGTTFTCKSNTYKTDTECKACPTGAICDGSKTFTCKDGYYKSGSLCAKCPTNSTCTSATNFTCNTGYYKSNNQCVVCPQNATCANNNITCNEDYYKSNSTCQKCPDGSTCTSASNFTCKQNYYKSGSKCESCGEITIKDENNEYKTIEMVTGAAGATDKSECHLSDKVVNPTYDTTYNGHNVTVRLTGFCSKN